MVTASLARKCTGITAIKESESGRNESEEGNTVLEQDVRFVYITYT